MAFFAECYRLRYPSDQSPTNGPVRLKDLNEFDGWLVGGPSSWYSGFTDIYRYDDAPGDKRSYGWVPNEYIAKIFRSVSSYGKPCYSVDGSTGVTNAPTNLLFSVAMTVPWSTIDFYEGATKIGQVTNGQPVNVTLLAERGGFYVFHAVATTTEDTNQPMRATYPRRVFVNGPDRLTPFQQWAETNLPSGSRGPKDVLHAEDGIPNLSRFVFNLGTNANPARDALPQFAGFTNTGGVRRALFQYRVGTAQRDSGVNIRPGVATNLFNWSAVRSPVFTNDPASFWRVGDTNCVLWPASSSAGFFRVLLDDRF